MIIIRFSDVILMLAEAEIEAGSLTTARTLINLVRDRANTSRTVSFPATEGTPNTKPYTAPFATKADALNAVRNERSLELGMEGWRFFDLVRWSAAETELNAFYNYESQFPDLVLLRPKPVFDPVKNSYYAIPQQQIDLSKGFIKP
jgi:starch-binding outer membrane protein, SusD/RagB family